MSGVRGDGTAGTGDRTEISIFLSSLGKWDPVVWSCPAKLPHSAAVTHKQKALSHAAFWRSTMAFSKFALGHSNYCGANGASV